MKLCPAQLAVTGIKTFVGRILWKCLEMEGCLGNQTAMIGKSTVISSPAISPELNSVTVRDWAQGPPSRWRRKTEAALGNSNWTQRIYDIWYGRLFSCFVSIFLLCGYIGVRRRAWAIASYVCVYTNSPWSICCVPQWSVFHKLLLSSHHRLHWGLQSAAHSLECAE